jgi:hypothetical protein
MVSVRALAFVNPTFAPPTRASGPAFAILFDEIDAADIRSSRLPSHIARDDSYAAARRRGPWRCPRMSFSIPMLSEDRPSSFRLPLPCQRLGLGDLVGRHTLALGIH